MSTTAPEYLTTLRDQWADAMQQWVDQSTSAWDQWSQAWAGTTARMPGVPAGMPGRYHDRHRQGQKACGCREPGHHGPERRRRAHQSARDCGCCRDACDCCVPEADVIVHARAGELRVVPFRLTNQWRREREVNLDVGPWHVCDGDELDVRSALEEDKLVLAPCEDRVVRLLVSVRGKASRGDAKPNDKPDDKPADRAADKAGRVTAAAVLTNTPTGRRAVDVKGCASAYADVRFEGCARPLRVAVVVSPAECDAVDVCCDCGCC